jgi:Cu/Ag efflux protein CusF
MKRTLLQSILTLAILLAAGSSTCRADTEQQKPKPEQKRTGSASGTIEKIDHRERTVTVRLVLATKTFKVAPDCEFVLGKKQKPSLKSLKAGDDVVITYEEVKNTLMAHRVARKGVGPDKEDAREREHLEQILTPNPSEQKP